MASSTDCVDPDLAAMRDVGQQILLGTPKGMLLVDWLEAVALAVASQLAVQGWTVAQVDMAAAGFGEMVMQLARQAMLDATTGEMQ